VSRPIFTILLHLAALAAGSQAAAQDGARGGADAADAKVDAAIAATKQTYGPPPPQKRCGAAAKGEIVVCGIDRGEDQRIPSTATSDPTSREALYDGLPRAPQLDRGSCKGEGGCMSFGYAPPPIYYIDIKALPEAPAGSDAELIAKGEKAEP
jgi:hypothetical protein